MYRLERNGLMTHKSTHIFSIGLIPINCIPSPRIFFADENNNSLGKAIFNGSPRTLSAGNALPIMLHRRTWWKKDSNQIITDKSLPNIQIMGKAPFWPSCSSKPYRIRRSSQLVYAQHPTFLGAFELIHFHLTLSAYSCVQCLPIEVNSIANISAKRSAVDFAACLL